MSGKFCPRLFMAFGKFCLRVLVGLGVFVLFGGKDALQFLVLSVVCTFGVGLIVVIPAAYLLGLLCTIWFIPFGGGRKEKEERKRRPPGWENEHNSSTERKCLPNWSSAIENYITAAESKGQEWEAIRAALIESGWNADMVDHVRERQVKTKECLSR